MIRGRGRHRGVHATGEGVESVELRAPGGMQYPAGPVDLLVQGALNARAGQDVVEGVEHHPAPRRAEIRRRSGGHERRRRRGRFRAAQRDLGVTEGRLEPGRGDVAPTLAVAEFPAVHKGRRLGPGGDLLLERREETVQARVHDLHLGVCRSPRLDVAQQAAGRAAAMIAETVEHRDVVIRLLRGRLEETVEPIRNFAAFAAVPAVDRAVAEHAGTARTLPPEGGTGQRPLARIRTEERERLEPGVRQQLGQAGAMAERVRRPGRGRRPAEMLGEEPLAVQIDAGERLRRRQVGVGLQVRAADGVPPSGAHVTHDPGKCLRFLAGDVLVEHRLAADVREVGELVHQREHRADRDEPLVESLAPVPLPDRIQVRVSNQMKGVIRHEISAGAGRIGDGG